MKVFRAIYGDPVTKREIPAPGYQSAAKLAVLEGFYLAESINALEYDQKIFWNKQPALTGSREDLRIMTGTMEGVEGTFYIDIRTEKAPPLINPRDARMPTDLSEHDLNLAEVYGELIEKGRYGSLEIVED